MDSVFFIITISHLHKVVCSIEIRGLSTDRRLSDMTVTGPSLGYETGSDMKTRFMEAVEFRGGTCVFH